MGQLKDLTGQKFGKLTVLRRAEDRKRGRPMWLCQCECGNQTVVSSTRLLLPNGTRSCGCLRHQPSNNLVDLTGKVFGHLTVLRRDESVTGRSAPLKHDLTGQEFGYLLVLGRVYNPKIKSKEVRWKCLCRNCGRIVQVSSYWLRISDPYGHCKCTRFHKPNQDEQD